MLVGMVCVLIFGQGYTKCTCDSGRGVKHYSSNVQTDNAIFLVGLP